MGSGASKTAAQSTIRKFPNRAPGSAVPPPPSTSAASRATAERTSAAAAAASAAAVTSRRPAPSHQGRPSAFKDEAIQEDGLDPHMASPDATIQPALAQRLREMGVVQPNPTYSPSSTASSSSSSPSPMHQQTPENNSGPIFPPSSSNPVLAALEARARVQREAEEEFENLGLSNSQGRRFLAAGMVRDILVMREKGASQAQIENRFNLRKGVMQSLEPKGLYKPAGGAEPAAP